MSDLRKAFCADGWVKRLLPKLVFLLCLMQPVLDVLSYWQDALSLTNTLTTVLRFGLLAVVSLLGFVLSEKKRYYYGLAVVLLLLTAGHAVACSRWGYDAPFADLVNLVRIYQLPLMTLAFVTFLRQCPACMESFRKGFFGCLLLCSVVVLLSTLTGTDPHTYPDKEVGFLGWFYFANSQSAIVSMLVPVALVWTVSQQRFRTWLVPVAAFLGFALLYGLATRLAYVSLLAAYVVIAFCLLLLRKREGISVKRPVALLLVLVLVAAAGYGVSPMTKNAELVAKNKILKQQDIDAKTAADEAQAIADGLTGEALAVARLESAYETYLTGPAGRFGLERTACDYGYSTNAGDIADVRREKLTFNRMLLEDNPGLSIWFGLEREDMSFGGESYDVENDFHGIFYLCGAVGLVLMLALLGWVVLRIAAALCRDFRGTFTMEAVGCGVSLCCGLAHAYFTAGVLRRPNATFYLAALLAMCIVLTDRKIRKSEVDS